MDQNTQRTQELLAQEGLESIGQKLFNKINNELAGDPQAARRWIWELLQNAKDVIGSNGRIEIRLTDDSVEFAHNGNPFTHDHLLALLSQRSSKSPNYTDDEKKEFFDALFGDLAITEESARQFLNTSGRFGTGFMTTYLLSKKVSLEGIYLTGNGKIKSFQLSLDRDADRPEVMKEKVVQSFSSFTELEKEDKPEDFVLGYREGSECYTKFTYYFLPEAKDIAEQGIIDLHHSIPFVLSFVGRISVVSIIEYGRETIYSRQSPKPFETIIIDQIEKKTPEGLSVIEIAKLSARYEALTIAIPIQTDNGKYKVILPNSHTPKQFISFPLVGSEAFAFPVIIHSPLFNPDDSRSHVFLNLNNSIGFDKKVNLNRGIFEKAVMLFKELLKIVSANRWDELYYFARTEIPVGIKGDWYKDSIQQEMRKEILDSAIVITEGNGRIRPRETKFPIYDDEDRIEEFWGLCQYLFGGVIPRKVDVQIWKEIITADLSDWPGAEFDLNLAKLLLQIQDEGIFLSFTNRYFKNEGDAFKALNEIICFTEEEDKELVNRKEHPLMIFPDQTEEGVFAEKRKLHRDKMIPREMKEVMKSLGDNWFEKLVRNEITVFDCENEFTVKIASDRIRDKIEKYFLGKLDDDDDALLEKGLFELAGYSTNDNRAEIEAIQAFLQQFFPDRVKEGNRVVAGAEGFDWKPFMNWAVWFVISKVSEFATLDNLSLFLFKKGYPETKENYSKEELDLKFEVDTTLNRMIQFVLKFDKGLLGEYGIIPNQLNQLCKYGSQLFNDRDIPKELKLILKDLGRDCRGSLLHEGVSVTMPGEPRDLKWICNELDDIVIEKQENADLKQPIRDLDKWISKRGGTIKEMEELFKRFSKKRFGIVLNTYELEERDRMDKILNSGMSADFAEMVKSGASAEMIKGVVNVIQTNPGMNTDKINEIASFLKRRPEFTAEKLEDLIQLSEGWDPAFKYTVGDVQKRTNLENGWRGEAFVYKALQKKGLQVDWRNRTNTYSENFIVDHEGEKHFILERFEKYDLIAKDAGVKLLYIQVKSTVTDLSDADQIAMPISIREWNFVFQKSENESFYLARVFNVNLEPVVYFMKLEKPEEF